MSNAEYQTEIADLDRADPSLEDESATEPLYRIYEGSRIAIGKGVGAYWKRQLDAGLKAYEHIHEIWEQTFQYYNNNQNKEVSTPSGRFHRGDGTENVIFSNLNIMLSA